MTRLFTRVALPAFALYLSAWAVVGASAQPLTPPPLEPAEREEVAGVTIADTGSALRAELLAANETMLPAGYNHVTIENVRPTLFNKTVDRGDID